MDVKAFKKIAQQEAKRAKEIKRCGNTPSGHDFQNPEVTDLMGEKAILKTCTKCGLGKYYTYEE